MMWIVSPATASAVEAGALGRLLVKKGVISEADLQSLEAELAKEQQAQEERVVEIAREASGVPGWVQRTTWKGDIRLRNEWRKADPGDDDNRQRIRFRYGFTTNVSDELQVGARLATGNLTSPTSTNQSFSTSFNNVGFNLDRAYLQYAPEIEGANVALIGGIMANPFWHASPLIIDGDVSFHGVAAKAETEVGPATAFLNTGAFSLVTDVGESASLWSVQGGVSTQPFPDADSEVLAHLNVTGALSYHDFRNVTSTAETETTSLLLTASSTNTAGLQDLNLLSPSLELTSKVSEVPVKVWGDWVHNTSAGEDDGWQIGFKVGKAKKPWSLKEGVEAGYFFQRLEADAIYDELADGDFHGGGTNGLGGVYFVKLATLKNSTLGVKWFDTKEVNGTASERDNVQIDWITKF